MGLRGLAVAIFLLGAAWMLPLAMGGAFSGAVPSVEDGSPAPPIEVVDLRTNEVVTLDDYRGRVVLLNLWATWCGPCLTEMPAMERLHRELGPLGLEIVAVSEDVTSQKSVLSFSEELGLTFDILHDPQQRVGATYQVVALPQSFIIDRSGRIVWREFGAARWDDEGYVERFRELLLAGAGS